MEREMGENGLAGAEDGNQGVCVRSLATNDFDQMAEAFVNWDHRFEQVGQGRFEGRIEFADFDGVQLLDMQLNVVLRARGSRAPDSFTLSPVLNGNADSRWRGRLLRPGMVNVAGPRHEMDHRTCRDYRHTAITVRRSDLERTAMGLVGVGHEALLGDKAFEIGRAASVLLVKRWKRALGRVIVGDEAAAVQGIGDGRLGERLVAELVRVLASGRVVDPVRLTPAQRIRAVRRAEEYARGAPLADVSVLGLCEVAGVSERSLHYAFLEVTGLSPKAYLKSLRLNVVRREILEAHGARGRIGEIAERHGFGRPGDFAMDYRRQFGVLPSEMKPRNSPTDRSASRT